MMLKSKSSAWARLKYLYILPLAAVAITAFARPEISRELEKISSTKVNELSLIKEVLPKKTEPLAPLDTTIVIKEAKVQETVQKTLDIEEIQEKIETSITCVYIDGKEVPNEELNSLDPKRIHSVSVFKGKTAKELFGENQDGVILIKTKEAE